MAGEFSDIAKRLKQLDSVLSTWGKKVLRIASTVIGQKATENYMRNAGAGAGRRSRVDIGPLRIVSGRLAKSLTQSEQRNPDAIEKIRQISSTKFQLRKGTSVEYAATHEYGDVRNVTQKQKGYFFHRFNETGDSMWRAMALSDQLRYPKRPYLGPAATDAGPIIQKRALAELERALEALIDE